MKNCIKDWSQSSPNVATFFPALGYGFGFVCLICIISNVGGCLIPFMKLRLYQRLLMFCVAMGAGVMVSTGCLVLIPEVRFWDNIFQYDIVVYVL